MQRQQLLSIVLVAVMLVPVASAAVPTGNSAPTQGEPAAALPATETGGASGAAGGSGSASGGSAGDGNYTRLYIEDGYRSAELKPGESETFNVTVGNSEPHAVDLDPHVVLPQVEGRPIQKSWVTVAEANTTLAAGEERTFTVTVEVPDDAELGRYHAQVAFTDETIAYRGRPARPVHAVRLSLEVFEEPSVVVETDRYYGAQVQAGEEYTYEIVVNNTGEEAVPLDPTLRTEERRHRRGGNAAQRSWFDVEAPSEVAPGENATVTVTVTPPESASVGDYDAEVDLGLKDPARPRHDTYWQRVGLHFRVWKQPEEPFETTVLVSERAENVTLTLEAGRYGPAASDDPVAFDVAFVAPNGTTVDHERVRVANRGSVSLGEDDPRTESQGPYSSRGEHRQFVYRVDDPTAGAWTVEIMPHNTTDFRYEILREES